MAINQFSDWTDEEFRRMLGDKKPAHNSAKEGNFEILGDDPIASSIDWRTNAVPVLNTVQN